MDRIAEPEQNGLQLRFLSLFEIKIFSWRSELSYLNPICKLSESTMESSNQVELGRSDKNEW